MKFTFGVVTYNSRDFIIEALESIRYQVNTYGKGHEVTLIVSDDASGDDTVELVNAWIERFGDIFVRTQVMTVENNTGIAHNYTRLIRNVEDDCHKILAGDDLISSHNIFEQIGHANPDNMTIFATVCFRDYKAYTNEATNVDMYYFKNKKRTNKKAIHCYELQKPFATPSSAIRRKFLTEECLKETERYTQFEDDPSQFYILTHNKNMVYEFIPEPLVLYRIHGKSLCNGGTSAHQIRFLDDLHVFKKSMLKYEKNIVMKGVLFLCVIETFKMKHRFDAKNSWAQRLRRFVNKRRARIVSKDAGYAEFVSEMKNYAEQENEFILSVKESAEEFVRSCV